MHNVTVMSDFASVLCDSFWKNDYIYLDLRLLLLQCCLLKQF